MPITISGSTGIAGVDGSASTPAVQGTDTNTGIAFPAADTVAVATGGTERMRVDSSGNVGIGTSSPDAKLTVSGVGAFGDGSVSAPGITNTGDLDTGIYFSAANTLDVATGGTAALQLDSSQNLKFNSGYGSVATAYGCRAWVNFNGTGAVAIKASGNVTSITDNGTGDYTVNFTNAMPDANYSYFGMTLSEPNSNTTGNMVSLAADGSGNARTKSTTAIRILVGSTDSIVPTDTNDISFSVVR